MGELFKLGILAFCLSISAQAKPTGVQSEEMYFRQIQVPATVWIDGQEKTGHLSMNYAGKAHTIISVSLLGMSVVSYVAGGIPFWSPLLISGVHQFLGQDLPAPKYVSFLENGASEKQNELIKIPTFLDYYRLRQVLSGRRNRIRVGDETLSGHPRTALLNVEGYVAKTIGIEMGYEDPTKFGAELSKNVGLRDIYFQGPYGLTGTCKTVLTALGIWP